MNTCSTASWNSISQKWCYLGLGWKPWVQVSGNSCSWLIFWGRAPPFSARTTRRGSVGIHIQQSTCLWKLGKWVKAFPSCRMFQDNVFFPGIMSCSTDDVGQPTSSFKLKTLNAIMPSKLGSSDLTASSHTLITFRMCCKAASWHFPNCSLRAA